MGWAGEFYDNVTSILPEDGDPVPVTADDDTTDIDFYLAQSGYISGTVYEADEVTPLGGATITARDNTTTLWEAENDSADGTGFYYINLPPGTYRLVADEDPGHMPQWWNKVTVVSGGVMGYWGDATAVTVVGTDPTTDRDFSLLTAQAVETNAASGIGTTSATLNGDLSSKGGNDNVTVSFEYGLDAGYGSETLGQSLSVTGAFSDNLTGLTAYTTYHFRAKAVGDVDTTPFYGDHMTFTTSTIAPSVTTGAATNPATTSATLNGNLTDLGTADNVTVSFSYGTADGGPYTTPVAVGTMTGAGPFSANLTGLTPGTPYYYIAKAVGSDGSDEGNQVSFTTSTTPPSVTTSAASDLATTSATLNGNLGSLGTASNVSVSFAWGTAAGGPYTNPVTVVPAMTGPGDFSAPLTGLTPKTTYYYIAKALGDGSVDGAQMSFTTSTIAPSVTTGAATNPATTSATLNGNLTLKGSASSVIVSFEWGLTTSYGSVAAGTPPSMTAPGNFSANLTGLTAKTTYHFKAIAAGDGTTPGSDMTFTTSTIAPSVTTGAATNPATTSATLNGNLGSLGTATSVNVSFEWGTTTSYGTETTAQSMTAIGAFTSNLTGLTAKTTYHFRAKAVGDGSAVYGDDMTFTTASPADSTAPTISLVNASEITTSGATVTWTTNEAATSQVEYGLTEEYGSVSPLDASLVNSHSVDLTGLKAGKTYHYRVISKDAANNQAVSADATFKTAASSGGMPVWAWVLIGLAAVGVLGAAAYFIRGRLAQG
jgi:hypothetical protein